MLFFAYSRRWRVDSLWGIYNKWLCSADLQGKPQDTLLLFVDLRHWRVDPIWCIANRLIFQIGFALKVQDIYSIQVESLYRSHDNLLFFVDLHRMACHFLWGTVNQSIFQIGLTAQPHDTRWLQAEFRRWRVDSLWGTGHKRCFWSRVSKKTQDINSFRVEWWHGEQDNSLFRTELRRSA